MDEAEMARTEALFRQVNETIAKTATRFEASEAEFLCECSDPHCAHRVEADLSDYDDIRADPTHFIVVEGHDEPRIERVVEARGGYAIVEKVGGTLRQIVRSLDPRTDPT